MQSEPMISTERIECAMNLEKPDRVPIWPDVTTSAAANKENFIAMLETDRNCELSK